MKGIALTPSAYERLRSWKTGPRDTFSAVVERMVPAKGTFDALVEASRDQPDVPDDVLDEVERVVREDWPPDSDAWK